MRLMAGAPPAKTQQLLERCQSIQLLFNAVFLNEYLIDFFLKRSCGRAGHGGPGLVCGKERALYSGEREHAEALVSIRYF